MLNNSVKRVDSKLEVLYESTMYVMSATSVPCSCTFNNEPLLWFYLVREKMDLVAEYINMLLGGPYCLHNGGDGRLCDGAGPTGGRGEVGDEVYRLPDNRYI